METYKALLDRVREGFKDPGRVKDGVFGAMMKVRREGRRERGRRRREREGRRVREGKRTGLFSDFSFTKGEKNSNSKTQVSLVNDGPVTLTIDSREFNKSRG